MSISIHRDFKQKTFEPGALESAIRALCSNLNVKPESVTGGADYRHADRFIEDKKVTIGDLGSIVFIEKHPEEVFLRIGNAFIGMYRDGERLRLVVTAEDTLTCTKAISTIQKSLELEEYKELSGNAMAPLAKRRQAAPRLTDRTPAEPEYPPKITISWLSKHAPIAFWFWLAALIFGAFVLGVKAAEVPWIKQLFTATPLK